MKEIVYSNNWFSVLKDENWHYLVEKNSNNGAAILILEDDTNFIFVENNRKAINKSAIEIPRGYGNDNEISLDCAIREAFEETGYKISNSNISKLGSLNPNSAILSSTIDIFFAKVSVSDKIKDSDEEVLGIIKIPKDTINQYILDGTIQDSFSLAALCLYSAK